MPDPEFKWVDIDLIEANPWNPNVMGPDMRAKEIESIHEFGFVDPVTVRRTVSEKLDVTTMANMAKGREWLDIVRYQIIDGEQRWTVAKDHGACARHPKGGGWERHSGLRQLPIADLGDVDDEVAQQLTIVLNETRGTYDPKKMGALLTDLITIKPLADLVSVLPFTKDKIEELAELPKVDWEDVRFKAKVPTEGEHWVERVYRLPSAAADALDRAILQCRDEHGHGLTDAQAIQAIAEFFLRGTA